MRAFAPTPLADRDLTFDARTVADAARAQAAVEYGAETMPEDFAAPARLLLRAEGVASSFIEGVTASVVDIVLAEADKSGSPSAASWVAANLAAVTEAIDEAHAGPLSIESLCGWHGTLMTGSPTPAQHVGALRSEQGWIGGTSPLDAHLVTPPPDHVPALVEDLLAYVNRYDIDPVSQAAIAHAQFEIIHPFADGNGRVGRVLVAWILVRSDAAAWRVLDLVPRHLVLTGPIVASELDIPLKSANAALGELVAAGVLLEHGAVRTSRAARPHRLESVAGLNQKELLLSPER